MRRCKLRISWLQGKSGIKKLVACEDIDRCGCRALHEFWQIKEVEVLKVDLLKFDNGRCGSYLGILFEYHKYVAVDEQDTQLYWLHHDLVCKGHVRLCNACHRSLFNPKKGQVPSNAIASGKH